MVMDQFIIRFDVDKYKCKLIFTHEFEVRHGSSHFVYHGQSYRKFRMASTFYVVVFTLCASLIAGYRIQFYDGKDFDGN